VKPQLSQAPSGPQVRRVWQDLPQPGVPHELRGDGEVEVHAAVLRRSEVGDRVVPHQEEGHQLHEGALEHRLFGPRHPSDVCKEAQNVCLARWLAAMCPQGGTSLAEGSSNATCWAVLPVTQWEDLGCSANCQGKGRAGVGGGGGGVWKMDGFPHQEEGHQLHRGSSNTARYSTSPVRYRIIRYLQGCADCPSRAQNAVNIVPTGNEGSSLTEGSSNTTSLGHIIRQMV